MTTVEAVALDTAMPLRGPSRPVWLWTVGALAAITGVALRWWVLAQGLSPTESDEAVLGLIAIRATRGEFNSMYWGQTYGGPVEAYVCAFAFLITGPSVIVSKLVGCTLAAVASVLTWRIGLRTIGRVGAVLAGASLWLAPTFFVWYSAKISIYFGTLTLATATLLCVVQLHDDAPVTYRRWWPPIFGLVAGLAFWASPQALFLLLPAGLVYAPSLCRQWRKTGLALACAVLGAAPWLVFNARNDWVSFAVPPTDVELPFLERVLGFFPLLPMLLNARHVGTERWVLHPALGVGLSLMMGALTIGGVLRWSRPWSRLAAIACLIPFAYALSPLSVRVAGGQPRYLLMAMPIVALLVGRLAGGVGTRPTAQSWRAVAALAVVGWSSVLTLSGLREYERISYGRFPGSPDSVAVPDDFSPLVALLRKEDIHYAYADYWLSFRATFETGEDTIVAPIQVHLDRYPPYSRLVAESERPAYITLAASRVPGLLETRLAELGVQYQRYAVAEFVVVVPDRSIFRDDVGAAFY